MAHHRAVGNTLLASTNQLNAIGAPGSAKSWPVTVTNTGAHPQLVQLHGQTFGADQNVQTGSVTLTDGTSPQFANYQGLQNNYGVLHFHVPSGRTGWTPRSPTRPPRAPTTTPGSG